MAKITAPAKDFTGTVVGVDFKDGVGETSNEGAIAYFERQGYTVELEVPDVVVEPDETPAPEPEAQPEPEPEPEAKPGRSKK